MNSNINLFSIVFVLIALCRLCGFVLTTTDDTPPTTTESIGIKDTLCYTITNNYELKMRAVLLVPGKLYIITQHWMMYDIPMDSLDDIKQLAKKLKSVKAKPLTDIWSGCNVDLFKSNKDNIITMYSTNDNNQTVVYMNIPNQRGLQYNLKTNNLSYGAFYNTSNSVSQKVVAPITGSRFYTIEYDKPDGYLYFIKWSYQKDMISGAFKQITTKPQSIYYSPKTQAIRLYNQNETKIESGFEQVRGKGEWQIINGITFKGRLLLFTSRLVYNFSESFITPGYVVKVETVNLKNFFECNVIKTITAEAPNLSNQNLVTSSSPSKIKITLMFVAAVAILIIILFAIYYIKKYMTDEPVNYSKSKYRTGSTSRSRRQMRDSLSRSRQIMAGSENKYLIPTKLSYNKIELYGSATESKES